MRTNFLWVLICVQTICEGYQHYWQGIVKHITVKITWCALIKSMHYNLVKYGLLVGICSWAFELTLQSYACPEGQGVECLTRDRRVAGLSITVADPLCPWARHINPCSVPVQPRKTRPDITEKMLTGTLRIKSNRCCWASIGPPFKWRFAGGTIMARWQIVVFG